MQLENITSFSEKNISTESTVNIEPNNATCILCDQNSKKYHSKRLLLFEANKQDFLLKVDQEDENLVNKLTNYLCFKIYYHNTCQLNYSYKVTLNKKQVVGMTS